MESSLYIYIYTYVYIYIYIYTRENTQMIFSVLHKVRCKKHLAILKAIAITLFHPSLWRQRRQLCIRLQFRKSGRNLES